MRKILKWGISSIVVVSVVYVSYIWGKIDKSIDHPDVEAQVLAFATLPATVELPKKQEQGETKTDFELVETKLLEQLPLGTTEASINAYLIEQRKPCFQNEQEIYCSFISHTISCERSVVVSFNLDSSYTLQGIKIRSGNICL